MQSFSELTDSSIKGPVVVSCRHGDRLSGFVGSMGEKLEDVIERVNEAWFPVNPLLLSRIQAHLAAGFYEMRPELLINEIKADASLFIYAVRELSKKLHSDKPGEAFIRNPVEALRNAGPEHLKSILSRRSADISIHTFDGIKNFQAELLRRTVIGASTSEILAPKLDLPGELGYSCALLRQLGLALIAWNYPSIYAKALQKGPNPDEYLSITLGFSPALLAYTLTRRWGFSTALRRGMGEKISGEASSDTISLKIGDTLEKICKTGELIARCNQSSPYPQARADWDTAKMEVLKYLGPDGFELLENKILETSKYYMLSAPELFKITPLKEPQVTTAIQDPAARKASLNERNPYIRGCSSSVQEKLESLYARLDRGHAANENVSFLLKEIIPEAGFTSGCVYLVEVEYQLLVPRLVVGNTPLESFKAVRYGSPENRNHPVVKGFVSPTPVMGDRKSETDNWIFYISGSIGNVQKAGVLYLEYPMKSPGEAAILGQTQKTISKALRQALSDCLNLE